MKRITEEKLTKLYKNYSDEVQTIIYAPFKVYSIGKYSKIISISKPFWKKLQVEGFTGWEIIE